MHTATRAGRQKTASVEFGSEFYAKAQRNRFEATRLQSASAVKALWGVGGLRIGVLEPAWRNFRNDAEDSPIAYGQSGIRRSQSGELCSRAISKGKLEPVIGRLSCGAEGDRGWNWSADDRNT